MKNILRKLDLEDLGQIVIGSTMLSVPIAFTEESWNLSESLPMLNLVIIILISLSFIGIYSYQGIYGGSLPRRKFVYLVRIILNYFITCVIVSIVLFSLDRLPVVSDTLVAIKRILIVAFPASMGAVVVDSFDKR